MTYTPLTGYNGRARWTARGYLHESKVHAVAASYESLRPALGGDTPVTTACGRTLQHVASIFGEDQWAKMWGEGVRLGRTHQVPVCSDCVRRAVPVCEVCGDTPEWCQHLRDIITPSA